MKSELHADDQADRVISQLARLAAVTLLLPTLALASFLEVHLLTHLILKLSKLYRVDCNIAQAKVLAGRLLARELQQRNSCMQYMSRSEVVQACTAYSCL